MLGILVVDPDTGQDENDDNKEEDACQEIGKWYPLLEQFYRRSPLLPECPGSPVLISD